MSRICLIIFVLLTLFSCTEEIAIYNAVVVDVRGNPVVGVDVLIEKDGEILPVKPNSLTGQSINKINNGEMYPEIVTDSIGKFYIGFMDSYIFKPTDYKIHLVKENYKKIVIEIKWVADIDNKIILEKL